eukprot:358832-Chlamydomonas_euryale.AAC.3
MPLRGAAMLKPPGDAAAPAPRSRLATTTPAPKTPIQRACGTEKRQRPPSGAPLLQTVGRLLHIGDRRQLVDSPMS